jgi:hypothetical protein
VKGREIRRDRLKIMIEIIEEVIQVVNQRKMRINLVISIGWK